MKNKSYIIIFLLIIFICISCEEHFQILPPVGHAEVIPSHGSTTTEFIFDGSQSISPNNDTILFFQWDWDGDTVWDVPISLSNRLVHRYKQKGIYNPILLVSDKTGLSDTVFIDHLKVIQGNSPPYSSFNITPKTSHFMTDFLFDASESYDEEDSSRLLKYRWDWESDGIMDTDYILDPIIRHKFDNVKTYSITLEVSDPSGLSSLAYKDVMVVRSNPRLFVDFTISPDSGTTEDPFVFKALDCRDLDDENNRLMYKWSLTEYSDSSSNTRVLSDFSSEKIFSYKFDPVTFGDKRIRLTVEDEYGLRNSKIKDFKVHYSNLPPHADFAIIPRRGNIKTDFYFRSTYKASDPEDYSHQLLVRWDFENDGIWDTDFSIENRTIFHRYQTAGEYEVICEVMDTKGLTDVSEYGNVYVSNGTNKTSFVEHRMPKSIPASWKYYGTVKIGTQWWTSENIQLPYITERQDLTQCYDNYNYNCENYGGLYLMSDLDYLIKNDTASVCPVGWHIPTNDDWEILIKYIGESDFNKEVSIGGSTDFNAVQGGEKIPRNPSNPFRSVFIGLGTYGAYWTSSKVGLNGYIIYIYKLYTIEFKKTSLFSENRVSLRCIKD